MSAGLGWLLVAFDVALGGYDFYRAITFASNTDFPATVLYVALTTFMAWCGAVQLRFMRQRRERNRESS